jgi:pSer/pThr/pTyr-binding forkhead associated (FHA) protein
VPELLSLLVTRYRHDPTTFQAAFGVPALMWEGQGATEHEAWERTREHASRAPLAGDPQVLRVEKTNKPENAFAMGITLGRVESNDLVIVDDSVSRFHAYLRWDERALAWFVTDAESKNGSWVNEVKVEANQRVRVPDKARLRFGDTRFTFLLPASLCAVLERHHH